LQQRVEGHPHVAREALVRPGVESVLVGVHRRADEPVGALRRRRLHAGPPALGVERGREAPAVARFRHDVDAQPLGELGAVGGGRLTEAEVRADLRAMPCERPPAPGVAGRVARRVPDLRGERRHGPWVDLGRRAREAAVRAEEGQQQRELAACAGVLGGDQGAFRGPQRPPRGVIGRVADRAILGSSLTVRVAVLGHATSPTGRGTSLQKPLAVQHASATGLRNAVRLARPTGARAVRNRSFVDLGMADAG